MQVPVPRNAFGVQIPGVVDAKLTGSPELAVAVKLGVVPKLWLPGLGKEIVCVALVTENDCETGIAAA